MAGVLVFDIETIPDAAGIRRLENIPDSVSDFDVVTKAMADPLNVHLGYALLSEFALDRRKRLASLVESTRHKRPSVDSIVNQLSFGEAI